ncbi:MAG: alpha/beta fold hydrolase, partial [Micromonosporaceae bacterium]
MERRGFLRKSAQALAVAGLAAGLPGYGNGSAASTGGAGVASAAPAAGAVASGVGSREVTFLFVHGSWHAAMHWNRVLAALTDLGHRAVAIDLPGTGLNAKFPQSYLTQDLAALTTEKSPVAGWGIDHYVNPTVDMIKQLGDNGKIILVGHSFAGLTVTKAADAVPDLIQRVVYLTAYVPVKLGSVAEYSTLPENGTTLSGTITLGDPSVTGAIRINPRSGDLAYLERGRLAFYNDVPTEDYLPFAAGLTPDLPLKAATDDARGTAERWGTLPRTFIRCTLDHIIPIALQDRMIREADETTPHNTFDVKSLDASHSPFASKPHV